MIYRAQHELDVIVVEEDIDLLVLMIILFPEVNNIIFLKPLKENNEKYINFICESQQNQ